MKNAKKRERERWKGGEGGRKRGGWGWRVRKRERLTHHCPLLLLGVLAVLYVGYKT